MASRKAKAGAAGHGKRKARAASEWDAFVSHSSHDKGWTTRLAYDLEELGKRVWVDYEYLTAGDLLKTEIGEAIRKSRAFVLMWSAATDKSPWVAQELQAALSAGQRILLCLLDQTSYQHHQELAECFWCDLRTSYDAGLAQLMQGLASLDTGGNPRYQATRVKRAPQPERDLLAGKQDAVLAALDRRDFKAAADLQAGLDPLLDQALRRWRHDPDVLSLAGYQHKNAVRIATRDGSKPTTARHRRAIDEAEALFQRALAAEPGSMNALNGLGTISAFRDNWEMAEHYCLRAIQQARQLGIDYTYAKEDLATIRAHKNG